MLSKVEILEKQIKETDLDLKAIVEEHNRYKVKDVSKFIEALPIESLKESLDKDYLKPRAKLSLKDVQHINKLGREFDKKQEELRKLRSDLRIAKLDEVQRKIDELL